MYFTSVLLLFLSIVAPGNVNNQHAAHRPPATATTTDCTITGTVKDDAGHLLSGVLVEIEGLPYWTTTDTNGHYKIMAPCDGTLIFSYSLQTIQEVSIKGHTVDVQLTIPNMPPN